MLKTLQKKLKVGKKAALSSHYDFVIPKVKKKVLFIFYRSDISFRLFYLSCDACHIQPLYLPLSIFLLCVCLSLSLFVYVSVLNCCRCMSLSTSRAQYTVPDTCRVLSYLSLPYLRA